MSTRKTEPMTQVSKEFQRLLRNMGIEEGRFAEFDGKLSTYQKMSLMASAQSISEIDRNLKLQTFKLRTVPTPTCLEIVRCYLDLNREDVYRCFLSHQGLDALVDAFGRLSEEDRPLFYSIVLKIVSHYGVPLPASLLREVCRAHEDAVFEILCFCADKPVSSLFFEGNYLEQVMRRIIRKTLGEPAIRFLSVLYASGDRGRKAFLKHFLIKTGFFAQVSGASEFEREVRKAICEKPPLSHRSIDARLLGIFEAVESLGVHNFVIFILENLLFGSEIDLRGVERRFLEHLSQESNRGGESEPIKQVAAPHPPKKDDLKAEEPSSDGVLATPESNAGVCTEPRQVKKVVLSVKKGPPRRRVQAKVPSRGVHFSRFKGAYMPIRWRKVQAGKSVWCAVSMEGASGLFSTEDLSSFEKREVAHRCVARPFAEPAIDPKKNNAVNIALGRVKLSDAELKAQIVGLELQDDNLIKQLLENFPTHEEFSTLATRERGFGRAETFFKECSGCSASVKEALRALRFIAVFRSQNVSQCLNSLESFYTRLIGSKAFVELLAILLFVGNVFNRGSALGDAEGFSLNDLGVFARVRGSDKRSVLDVAIDKLRSRKELFDDLSLLGKASQVSLEGVEQDMSDLERCLPESCERADAKLLDTIREYRALHSAYEKFRALQRRFEVFVGTKADVDFYDSLEIVQKSLMRVLGHVN